MECRDEREEQRERTLSKSVCNGNIVNVTQSQDPMSQLLLKNLLSICAPNFEMSCQCQN